MPQRTVEATAARIWGAIGRTLVEYALLGRICDPASERVRVIDLGGLEHIRRTGRPGIFVSAHLANWNLLPLAAALRASRSPWSTAARATPRSSG